MRNHAKASSATELSQEITANEINGSSIAKIGSDGFIRGPTRQTDVTQGVKLRGTTVGTLLPRTASSRSVVAKAGRSVWSRQQNSWFVLPQDCFEFVFERSRRNSKCAKPGQAFGAVVSIFISST